MENEDTVQSELPVKGRFIENLTRNNKKIKLDRAIAISEDAELIFKREIEDMQMQAKRLRRERENMLDLSPATADSLILASDFDAKDFVNRDIDLGVKLRNLEIRLQIAEQRYNELFG